MSKQWSQSALAKAAQVSPRTIQGAENGQLVFASTVEAIAQALDVNPEELLSAPSDAATDFYPWFRGDGKSVVDQAEIEGLLSAGRRSAASCSAYLVGDLSVLVTKRAYTLPVDAKIHVSVSNANETSAKVFFPCARDRWALDEGVSLFIVRLLARVLADPVTRERFPKLPHSVRTTIVSEIPADVSLYEESALASALAAAMLGDTGLARGSHEFEVIRLAAALTSGWYADVAYASLLASRFDPMDLDNRVLYFDRRSEPKGIDLLALYEGKFDSADLEGGYQQNLYPSERFWRLEEAYFNVGQLSIWWDGTSAVPSRSRSRGAPIAALTELPLNFVVNQMTSSIDNRGESGEEQFGLTMQMHHLMLATVGFVDRDAAVLIAKVNGLADFVLGAKLAGGRGRGAIVVLTKRASHIDDLKEKMKELQLFPLDEFRSKLLPSPAQ